MKRFALESLILLPCLVSVAWGQAPQPTESKNAFEGNVLSQSSQLNTLNAQNAGLGVVWGGDVTNSNTPIYFYANNNPEAEGSGLSLAPVDDAARAHLKIPKGQGLIATSVSPQGAAAQAGICQNDIFLTLGDAPLAKSEDVEKRLKAAGEKPLGLVLLHQGEKKTIQVQPHIKVYFGPVQPAPPAFWIGVTVAPVEPALRAQLKLPADQGLIATQIIDNGPAAKAGLKVNDILLTMGEKPLRDQAALVDLVQKLGDEHVAVDIVREGSRRTIDVTPERRNNITYTVSVLADLNRTYNVVHPGVVYATKDLVVPFDAPDVMITSQQHKEEPVSKRLDSMSAEIKQLRKAVEDLGKVLKDRK
jgi:serine protease Do